MGNILDFEEEKAKKELNDRTPEELLEILLDDKKCDELVKALKPLVEQKYTAIDLAEELSSDVYSRVEAYIDSKYGDAKNTEATAEMITMCSTIAMKIMVYALSMLPREERGSHLDKMKDMTMMCTELFIHRLLSADTGEEE